MTDTQTAVLRVLAGIEHHQCVTPAGIAEMTGISEQDAANACRYLARPWRRLAERRTDTLDADLMRGEPGYRITAKGRAHRVSSARSALSSVHSRSP